MESLFKALSFAAEKHKFQKRKGDGSPYINHPIAVANILARNGITDPVVLQAALLHDTLEDTQTTPRELEDAFGKQVLSVVQECSDDKSLGKAERKKLQIEHAAKASSAAKLVKMADKLANFADLVQGTSPWDEERTVGYLLWGLAVFDSMRGVSPALEQEMQKLLTGCKYVLPLNDPAAKQKLLQAYYASMEVAKD